MIKHHAQARAATRTRAHAAVRKPIAAAVQRGNMALLTIMLLMLMVLTLVQHG